MPSISANGTELYYELSGTGPPVVFTHGSWGDHYIWSDVVKQLTDDFTVLTWDRRGHSKSPPKAQQGSLQEDADDLAALMKELELTPAHGVGTSSGALITLRTAMSHPEVFCSVFVHEPPAIDLIADDPAHEGTVQESKSNIAPVIELLEAGKNEEAARLFMETIAMGPGAWEQLPEHIRTTYTQNAPTYLDETRNSDFIELDPRPLDQFDGPILVSSGDQSPDFFPAIVNRITNLAPNVQTHTFGGAGHVPYRTHTEEYVSVLRDFLSQ